MVAECLDRNRGKRDHATAARSLRLRENQPHTLLLLESPFYRQAPGVKIDILPLEAEGLPHSQPGRGQQNQENMQPITAGGC